MTEPTTTLADAPATPTDDKVLREIAQELRYQGYNVMAGELIAIAERIDMNRDDYATLLRRCDYAEGELRCPDCDCATPDDAGSKECGCDSSVCSRSVQDGTLAEQFTKLEALRDAADKATLWYGRSNGPKIPEMELLGALLDAAKVTK